MFDPGADATALTCAVTFFRDGVDELLDAELCRASDGELLDAVRELEVQRRRLAAVDAVLVAELDQRNVAGEQGCRNTAALLTDALRIDAREAAERVRAAKDLGPRLGLSGEPLPPIYATVAGAVEAGAIAATHARIIAATIEKLPHDVQAEKDVEIEAFLTDQARQFNPSDLRIIARRLYDTYDQDGRLADDTDREQRRHLIAHQHADASVSGRFHLPPVGGEALLTVLDALGQPVPGPHGERDPRSAGQRNADAVTDALLTVLRTGELPATGGITTTIVLTMTEEQLAGGASAGASGDTDVGDPDTDTDIDDTEPIDRLVRTGHGALLDVDTAWTLLGDAQIIGVKLGALKRIEAYTDTHRIFTQNQRLAMAARDHGCSFPGCVVGPARCQAHHVVDFGKGGKTAVENGTLLCRYHHAMFETLGWRCEVRGGIPHWIPPIRIDPLQRARRNLAHPPEPTPEGFP